MFIEHGTNITVTSRTDYTFQRSDGEFHYIDWKGSGPIAHFAHATGHFVPMERPDETTRVIFSFLEKEALL